MPDFVDMRPVKSAARRLLPPDNPLLPTILGEPDHLARDVAAVKLATYYSIVRALQRSKAS